MNEQEKNGERNTHTHWNAKRVSIKRNTWHKYIHNFYDNHTHTWICVNVNVGKQTAFIPYVHPIWVGLRVYCVNSAACQLYVWWYSSIGKIPIRYSFCLCHSNVALRKPKQTERKQFGKENKKVRMSIVQLSFSLSCTQPLTLLHRLDICLCVCTFGRAYTLLVYTCVYVWVACLHTLHNIVSELNSGRQRHYNFIYTELSTTFS